MHHNESSNPVVKLITKRLILLLIVGVCLGPRLWAQQTSDSDPAPEKPVEFEESTRAEFVEIEQLAIVGTRRKDRSLADSPVPVDLIDSEHLSNAGNIDPKYVLSLLAPSFVAMQSSISGASSLVVPASLRGLPADSTLLLINGKRRHRASIIALLTGGTADGSQGADLSTIPLIALKRVEILRDGSSAQYGSDAIAGVINYVLKDSPSASSMELRWRQHYAGDGGTYTIAANVGMPFSLREERTGFANFSVEFTESDPTAQHVPTADAEVLEAKYGQYLDSLGHRILSPTMSWGNPEVKYHSKFLANLGLPLTDRMEAYLFTNVAQRETNNNLLYYNPMINSGEGFYRDFLNHLVADLRKKPDPFSKPVISYGFPSIPQDPQALPILEFPENALTVLDQLRTTHPANFDPDNPDLPAFYTLNERFPAGFRPRYGGIITEYSVAGGIRGTLENDWAYDASVVIGQHDTEFLMESYNPQLLRHEDFIGKPNSIPTSYNRGSHTETDYTLNLDWSHPFEISRLDSPLYASVGLEYRVEDFEIKAGDEYSRYIDKSDGGMLDQGFELGPGFLENESRDRGNYAAYLNLEANPLPKFLLDTAVRFEEFEDFGSTLNGKLAGRWQTTESLALRGSFNTGFRAPTVGQSSYQVRSGTYVDDPKIAFLEFPTLVTVAYLPPSDPRAQALGAKPLEPEKSINYNLGTVFNWNRLRVTVDLYHIEVKERISYTDYLSVPAELQKTDFDGAGYARYLFNSFDTTTQGIDVVASYPMTHGLGRTTLTFVFNVNRTEIDRIHSNPNGSAITQLRTNQIETNLPKYRFTLGALHTSGPWSFNSRLRYYGSYTEYHTDLFRFLHEPDAKWLVDLEGKYTFDNGMSLAAGAQNLFGTYPSTVPQYASALSGMPYPIFSPFSFNGGMYYLKATYSF